MRADDDDRQFRISMAAHGALGAFDVVLAASDLYTREQLLRLISDIRDKLEKACERKDEAAI